MSMATAFPLALGGAAAGAAPPQQGYVDPYEAQLRALRAQMQAPQQPMYSPEEVAQRQAQNQREYELGLLGQLSGDDTLAPVGAQVFRQALGNRQKRITERGTSDPITGQFSYNPDYLRERDEQALAGLEGKSAAARAAWGEQRQRAEERADLERQRAEDRRALHAIVAAGRDHDRAAGSFSNAGFTPDGKQVVTNSRSGVNYVLQLNPDGTPRYTPYADVFTPKAAFEKNVASAGESQAAATRADTLLRQVKTNPDSFGLSSALVSAVPGALQGYAAKALALSPDQMEMRARLLREAALEINALYGAALSSGESARAATFLPNAADPPETVIAKLTAARDWARSSAAMQGPAANRAASSRSGGTTGPRDTPASRNTGGATGSWDTPGAAAAQAQGGGAGLSPDEQQELRELRARFPGR
jgi:hypothetical protein